LCLNFGIASEDSIGRLEWLFFVYVIADQSSHVLQSVSKAYAILVRRVIPQVNIDRSCLTVAYLLYVDNLIWKTQQMVVRCGIAISNKSGNVNFITTPTVSPNFDRLDVSI
jgi:hypothetical protein